MNSSFKTLVSTRLLPKRDTSEKPNSARGKLFRISVQALQNKSETRLSKTEPTKGGKQASTPNAATLIAFTSAQKFLRPVLKQRSKSTNSFKKPPLSKIKKKASLPSEINKTDFDDEYSITDFSEKPKVTRFSSELSTEAKISLIKTYEDMIYFELLVHFPVNIKEIIQEIKLMLNTEANSYNLEPLMNNNEIHDPLAIHEMNKKHKLRYSHFVQTAQVILDLIDEYKKKVRFHNKDSEKGRWVFPEDDESIKNVSKIINMYRLWIYLWNREYRIN